MIRPSLRVLCLAAAVCAVPRLAAAQDDAFRRGLEARGDRKWADVVRHMQRAVESEARESTRKVRSGFLGVSSMEYLPHYFLGEAYFNLQDCGAAVTEWTISEQHGAIKSRQDFLASMRKNMQACAAKGVLLQPDYVPLHAAALKTYTEVSALARRVSDLGATHREVWRADVQEQYAKAKSELDNAFSRLNAGTRTRLATDFNESRAASERAAGILRPLETSLNAAIDAIAAVGRLAKEVQQFLTEAESINEQIDGIRTSLSESMQASRKSGREQIAQARERLAAGQKTQSPSTMAEALKYAQSASTVLSQVLEQAKKAARSVFEQQFAERVRLADEAFARISAAVTTLDRRAAQKPDLVSPDKATTRAALEKQIDGLRRRFDRARRNEDLAGLDETTRLAGEVQAGLDALIKSFGPLSLRDRGIHAALEEGARLYLNGDYQGALTALEPLVGQSGVPMLLHAHVFRAASLFALYVRTGESDESLRSRALAEIAQSKQIDPSFQPSPRAFSPRFVQLYQTGGAAAPPPAASASR